MGGSSSSIKDYQLGQSYFTNADSNLKLTLSPATSILDKKKYTVFQFAKEKGKLNDEAERYVEVLKTTRHPYILRYLTSFTSSQQESVVTEHVIPLDVAVEKQEKEEIYAGLRNILEAILFLHEKSFICHNDISVSSVYVSDDGEWKLAAFENCSKVLRLSKKSFDNDITGFKEFALSVLEYLKDDIETTIAFMKRLGDELSEENKNEPCTLRSILEDPFFKFPYLQALDGIQKLPLKSTEDKNELFRDLHDVLQNMSPLVVCHRFIPILFSHMVITDTIANELFMSHLFASGNDYCVDAKLQPVLDKEHFMKYSLPKILSLYKLRDVTVRLTVMKYLPLYVDCIEKEILQEEVLPELLVGLKDTNDKVVQETFLALASIVAILGGNVVVGGESTTYFFDRTPDFSRFDDSVKDCDVVATKVSDVLKTTKPKKKEVDELMEERKRKRLERAKQREEQRKFREQLRLEREVKKEEQILAAPFNVKQPVEVEAEEDAKESDGNESEADWAGFEVHSNSSDQEVLTSSYQAKIQSPTTGYPFNNMSSSEIDLTPMDDYVKTSEHSTSEEEIKPKESRNGKMNLKSPKENNKSQARTDEQILPKITSGKSRTSQQKTSETGSQATSKIDSEEKKDEKTTVGKKSKDLGNEFDIKINKNKFTMEPDYFADMEPSFGRNDISAIYVDESKTISDKFSVNTNIEAVSAWDDDSWGEDDF